MSHVTEGHPKFTGATNCVLSTNQSKILRTSWKLSPTNDSSKEHSSTLKIKNFPASFNHSLACDTHSFTTFYRQSSGKFSQWCFLRFIVSLQIFFSIQHAMHLWFYIIFLFRYEARMMINQHNQTSLLYAGVHVPRVDERDIFHKSLVLKWDHLVIWSVLPFCDYRGSWVGFF